MTDDAHKAQLAQVFEYLGNEINPEDSQASLYLNKSLFPIFSTITNYLFREFMSFIKDAGKWEKTFLIAFIVSLLTYFVCTGSLAIVENFKISKTDLLELIKLLILIVDLLAVLIGFSSFILFVICYFLSEFKKMRGLVRNQIKQVVSSDIPGQEVIIERLQNDFEMDILKEAEVRFSLFIEQQQKVAQSLSNLTPIIIIYFILYYGHLGFSSQPLQTWVYSLGKGTPGVFAIISYIVKFLVELIFQNSIFKYKRYLSMLKIAQLRKNAKPG